MNHWISNQNGEVIGPFNSNIEAHAWAIETFGNNDDEFYTIADEEYLKSIIPDWDDIEKTTPDVC